MVTQSKRFFLEESTGLRPVTISKRRTPYAKTSVFSSTIPCIKYSGARYPNVPSIGITAWWVHLLGSHFASPKSVIYTKTNIQKCHEMYQELMLLWNKFNLVLISLPVVRNLVQEGHLRLLCHGELFCACSIYEDNADLLLLLRKFCIW